MSASPLVSYVKLSPNSSGKRDHAIDTVTVHCMAGDLSVESCGELFAKKSTAASSNYGIGSDGRIALYVSEDERSWCSSNRENDDRAVTVEVANTETKEPYRVSGRAYAALIDLLEDVCRRNGIKKLLWQADRNLVGQPEKQNMTVHRWFANKSCPGDFLFSHMADIAEKVNARLAQAPEGRYQRLEDVPDWARDTCERLIRLGGLRGTEKGLDLSEDMLRVLTLCDRMGAFGAAEETA